MFDVTSKILPPGSMIRYELMADESQLTFAEVLNLWKTSADFRAFHTQLLMDAPYAAYRWETPALSLATADTPFEFVLLDAPHLCTRAADAATFSDYYTSDDVDFGVVAFDNLGGDATMVVPSPRGSNSLYGHLADFVRSGPSAQIDALWRVIGQLATSQLSERPLWINTEGSGVAWLHVRLDTFPKYYGYKPYRLAE